MKNLIPFVLVFAVACSSGSSERPSLWMGEWRADWSTPPESYPGVEDMEFHMDGVFVFSGDSLTVQNNGYPGCIFTIDTLKHTQLWKVSNDTLFGLSDPSTIGMTYKINYLSEDTIRLQVLEDIFITLTRPDA